MTTLSQLVDELADECKRPDMLLQIAEFTNQTIRELHMRRAQGGLMSPVHYDSNRVEDEIEITALPAQWDIPAVTRFQKVETIYCVERGTYLTLRHPTRALESGFPNRDPYFYRAGSYVVLNGIAVGETAKISYFEFLRFLTYYVTALRPATWNPVTEAYTYLSAYNVNDASRENARNLTINWMLLRWSTVVKEGVRAKIWKRLGEEMRAKMSFSAYEALRDGMQASESFVENAS